MFFYLPSANSSFCVSVDSLDGVGTGKGFEGTKDLIFKSSGLLLLLLSNDILLSLLIPVSFPDARCIGESIAISCFTRSPLSWSMPSDSCAMSLGDVDGEEGASSVTSWNA